LNKKPVLGASSRRARGSLSGGQLAKPSLRKHHDQEFHITKWNRGFIGFNILWIWRKAQSDQPWTL